MRRPGPGRGARARPRGRRAAALLALLALAACSGPSGVPLIGPPAPPGTLSVYPGARWPGTIYVAQGGRIWKLKGGRISAVTPSGQSWDYPAASPDGRVTAAAQIGKGHAEIATGGADFANLSPLTHPVADLLKDSNDLKPAVSPDGRRLAFISDRSAAYSDEAVWEGPFSPYRPRQVSFPPDGSGGDDSPAYLADGSAVLLVMWRAGRAELGQVTLPAARPRVVSTFTDQDVMDPAPGPDGRLAAIRRRAGRSDVAISATPAGDNPTLVTTWGDARQPAWSPDGRSLVFISPHGGSFDLYQIPAAGGRPQRLTWGADLDANARPAWIA
ncbi:MAG TPA: hypothetical protein VG245_02490 [Candidatus Dormibacteraeota bacterium]|nr:hypothetical protein [Candidatus Dormibacteraeota bacterium]